MGLVPKSPVPSTTYLLTVTDGFNSASIYNRLTPDAGNPGCTYYWSNGATTRTLEVGTTGIGYDEQRYGVRVTGANGCVDSAGIIVVFTFSACEAIAEHTSDGLIALYPNPTTGLLHLEISQPSQSVEVTVSDVVGAVVLREKFDGGGLVPVVRDVDMLGLPAGLYLITLECGNYVGTVKFVRR